MRKTACIGLILFLYASGLMAQDSTGTVPLWGTKQVPYPCSTKDLTDYFRQWFNIKTPPRERQSSIFIAPVILSSPSTGFVVGATVQGAFQLPHSNLSAFQSNVQYTSKQQFSISLKNNVYANANTLFLSGDWSYFDYSQPTYGLGTNAPYGKLSGFIHFNDSGEPDDTLVQPMVYKHLKLHQTLSFKLLPNFYVGPGLHLDYYSGIQDKQSDSGGGITSHYAYSIKHGFDPEEYTVAGVSLNLAYDSRDNLINAYKGVYANLNYRVNTVFLGSDKASSTLWAEVRTYKGVSKKTPQKVLAFWGIGHFTVSGDVPYLNLPALGNDQRNRTGRGYTIARFRGNHMVYGELEYRFPISRCTRTLGGVVFLNAVTTSNRDGGVDLFEYVKPGIGAGVRVLFKKRSRMNIAVDYGRGSGSSGIYFYASEAF